MKFFYDTQGRRWNSAWIVSIIVINLGERFSVTMITNDEVTPVHYVSYGKPWKYDEFCEAFGIEML